jgi:threonine aldolase
MARAEVGDDVYGEDPTVARLEQAMAQALGKERALFVPSGTMGNQLAIACRTRPGDEVLVPTDAHPVHYESGAAAALSGVQLTTIGQRPCYTVADLEASLRPRAYYAPIPRLVCIENTHNRGGGVVFPQTEAEAICAHAHALGLGTHLDGARLWNASVASGKTVGDLARPFETVTVCFSKGLGAPVGSMLAGPAHLLEICHRLRKMWGAGMRQVGILAAGALYAFEHNTARIRHDHDNAKAFAEAMGTLPGTVVSAPETNMVLIGLAEGVSAEHVLRGAKERGLLVGSPTATTLRAVLHMDVSADDARRAAGILRETLLRAPGVA